VVHEGLRVRGYRFPQSLDHFPDVFVVFDAGLFGNRRFDRLHRRVERASKELKLTEGSFRAAGLQAVYQSGSFTCGLLVEFHE
jgi:hypothetical protein